jgi:hypothetical protein
MIRRGIVVRANQIVRLVMHPPRLWPVSFVLKQRTGPEHLHAGAFLFFFRIAKRALYGAGGAHTAYARQHVLGIKGTPLLLD